jgi:hypothetical protein
VGPREVLFTLFEHHLGELMRLRPPKKGIEAWMKIAEAHGWAFMRNVRSFRGRCLRAGSI